MSTIVARQVIRGFALLLAIAVFAPLSPAVAGVRDDHPNLVGGEVLGRGFVITGNYERFLNNHFGLGAGIMAIATSGGTVGILPLYVSYLSGNEHSLYLAAGAALFGGGSGVQDFEGAWVMQGTVGYQFQAANGFFVRPIVTFNQPSSSDSGEFLMWPGITIGGSF